MKRSASIKALISKADTEFKNLKVEYDQSLHDKQVREELKVDIKNIFENLRSCLDYIAHDIFESQCAGAKEPARLYFPIRQTAKEFGAAITTDFPDLESVSPASHQIIEAIQPYNDPWLGQFNKLNNHNKHQDLVEQTRTEQRQVTVSRGDGSVSWGPGVTFGSGVSVVGIPIDPRTQMPVPNNVAKTEVTVWVDFKFSEINESVIPFVEKSINRIKKLFSDLEQHV